MYPTISKGSLLINKHNGQTATVLDVFTKLFRDANDWAAEEAGFDSCTAATAVRVIFHANGYEKTYKRSDVLRLFTIHTSKEAPNGQI
jgi:hypothetical protein